MIWSEHWKNLVVHPVWNCRHRLHLLLLRDEKRRRILHLSNKNLNDLKTRMCFFCVYIFSNKPDLCLFRRWWKWSIQFVCFRNLLTSWLSSIVAAVVKHWKRIKSKNISEAPVDGYRHFPVSIVAKISSTTEKRCFFLITVIDNLVENRIKNITNVLLNKKNTVVQIIPHRPM